MVGAPARGLGRLTSVLRVAVLLPIMFERGGEFLADVAALEAAGAYAELIEGSDPVSLVVLGAMAAATHRVQVGCVRGEAFSAEAWSALDRISGGRAMVFVRGERSDLLTIHGAEPGDAWIQIEMPADRMAWREALATHTARGAAGLIVPWDPRLVDLLRNQDADDDRSDLQMSTG